ncbi:zinc-dependent alcohol dehydrogenase family protein [Dongia soli]|uniref:Zinc-dependent alcohol dehydrogenase family protein n=1 Tax=Dongia soli TaxID=600628 RepID=A0ABU5EBW9_9PROT|nr:zinc-dependent alcohol dehydrogenase family protein [Dongia soli]MDY0883372.1 zinc-dependent alcohol dehydrogenase family protein [Dongia soli]
MTKRDTMQAAVLEQFNAPLSLRQLPKPVPHAGQVLVRILASGVNPLDVKIRAGAAAHAKVQTPAILGLDLAGVVEAVGAGVDRFKRGDEVYGMTGGVGGVQGSLAEYAAVDADLLAIRPANLTAREAAALPLIFITAWEGLVDRAQVQRGRKVLIQGGAGGVGHLAIQIAKARGASVFATVSASQSQVVESFGAAAIDCVAMSVEDYVARYADGEGFDIVYDTVGGAVLDASFEAVRPYEGRVVSCLGWGTHALAPLSFRGATYAGVFTLRPLLTGRHRRHHGEILQEATKLAEKGLLRPILDARHFTLNSLAAAYESIETHSNTGKIVIDIGG